MKQDREEALTLEILQAIEAKSDVTQRHLADRMGVALGLANSYLRRCVRKGFVKITQAPANRYLYYLTPKGFTEKSRLTAQYLAFSFEFYRRASTDLMAGFARCRDSGARLILFAGVSELAEIGTVRAADFGLEIVGTYDPASSLTQFVGRPVWRRLLDIGAADAAVLTSLVPTEGMYDALTEYFGKSRVFVPEMLRPLAVNALAGA